jgi:thiol-disulfide isomerase/thioredoxin
MCSQRSDATLSRITSHQDLTMRSSLDLHHAEHPTMAALCDYRDHLAGSPRRDAEVDPSFVSHVAACIDCQQSLAFVTTLAHTTAHLPAPTASAALRARVLASVAASPADTTPSRSRREPAAPAAVRATARARRRWGPLAAVAAALGVIALGSLFTGTPDVVAGATAGVLELSTPTPRNGERVDVRYTPGASLSRHGTLRLRARVRTPEADGYTALTPVTTLATLQREGDGSYRGSFLLADSLVYAALAVEDTSATEIDDRDGRAWEVMRAGANGKVTLAALDQRAGDHMGRSWEEIFVTAQRMVAEYPDSIRAWSYLATANSWMGLSIDSIHALHIERVRTFDRALRASPNPSTDDMGQLYWYARWIDSTIANPWQARLRREAPANTFIVQNRLRDVGARLAATHDTLGALRTLELIWSDTPTDRKQQVVLEGTGLAVAFGDSAALRRWTDRLLAIASAPSPLVARTWAVRSVALDFAEIPALRAEGLQRLRDELTRLRASMPLPRSLDETQEAYRARVDRVVRSGYTALGKALALDGQHRAALDTLALAAADAWDTEVFRAMRTEALAVGDTATALDATAKLLVDPRTTQDRAAPLDRFGRGHMGAERWPQRLTAARSEFVERTLSAFRPRTIARAVPVQSLTGTPVDLRASLKGQVTVVAFLSRFCGPAIEVLPALQAMAARLDDAGVRTVAVFEELTPSPELKAFLAQHKVTLPVLLDHEKAASSTFNQWGTPYFYVVDERGRIMSEPTASLDELLVHAEAVRLAAGRP